MPRPYKTDRNQLILKLKKEGKTHNELAKMFDLTKSRIGQIYRREKASVAYKKLSTVKALARV